jgi:hypothetical protein
MTNYKTLPRTSLNSHFMEDGTRGEKVSLVSGFHSNENEISVLL